MNVYKQESMKDDILKKTLILERSSESSIVCFPHLLTTLMNTNDINLLQQIVVLINSYFEADSNECIELTSLVNESHLNYLISLENVNTELANDVLLFCLNISNYATEGLLSFFSSQPFFLGLVVALQSQSPKVVEIAILLTGNLVSAFPTVRSFLIENMIIQKIISIKLNDLIIFERKSWILALFLQSDLGDNSKTQFLIYNQLIIYLQSKFDSVKCHSIKGFNNAFDWSMTIVDFFFQNNVIKNIVGVLWESESKKLTRLILMLFQKIVKYQPTIQIFLDINIMGCLSNIIKTNEDTCSALSLDLIQTMIPYIDPQVFKDNFDFSILLLFRDKGFIAKKKFIEFIYWILKENINELISSVFIINNTQIMEIINDVSHCGDIEICITVIKITMILEKYELTDYLLKLLTENGEFKEFLSGNHEKPDVIYMEEKISQVSQIFD